ncbi:MAG: universal stress protein [Chloroflexota bacterium]|nr:universal stress protein [Chloroflexota bacterium]MDH5243622.1 universal stress protein [Chloroflexota bacterium]
MDAATSRRANGAASLEPFGAVLLATDLSTTSTQAEAEAVRLAAGLGARLVAVSVIDPGSLRLPGGRYRARVDQVRDERETAAQELVARAHDMGVPTAFLVWEGDPGESIVEAASAEHADLIVLGTHGRHGVDRALFGSVSDHVVRNAPCPVVVVRGAA